jgi:hypothetical protein
VQGSSSEDFTLVRLSLRAWFRLNELWSRPPKKHAHGGFQDRLAAWKASADPHARTVLLSHTQTNPRRLDDMTFIANAIIGKLQGGWQASLAWVFEDCHPRFSGLPVRPRKR